MGKNCLATLDVSCYFYELTLLDFSWKAVKGKKESEMQMSDYYYCSVHRIKIRASLTIFTAAFEDNTTQNIVIRSRPETSGSNGHHLQTKHIKDQTLGSTKELVLSLPDPRVHVSSLSWERTCSLAHNHWKPTSHVSQRRQMSWKLDMKSKFTSGLISLISRTARKYIFTYKDNYTWHLWKELALLR